MWVSPFRYLRINVYLPLPAAFRSLSRLSSALSAKASTLRSLCFYISQRSHFLRFTFYITSRVHICITVHSRVSNKLLHAFMLISTSLRSFRLSYGSYTVFQLQILVSKLTVFASSIQCIHALVTNFSDVLIIKLNLIFLIFQYEVFKVQCA